MNPKLLSLKFISLMLGLFLITTIACTKKNVSTHEPGRKSTNTIMHDGLKRPYHLYVPALYDSKKPAPLVFGLHGGGGKGNWMGKFTGLRPLADQYGFIAIYPNAVEKNWNDGRNLKDYRSMRENIDDVGFISALIDTVANQYAIDRKRVYSQCNQGVKVILYEIMGGGHTWPGGSQYLPEWIVGIVSKDINAGEVIWDFFEGFSMPD